MSAQISFYMSCMEQNENYFPTLKLRKSLLATLSVLMTVGTYIPMDLVCTDLNSMLFLRLSYYTYEYL